MNLILTIFFSIASVFGSYWIIKSQLGKAISMSLHGYSSSKLIGGGQEGERPRAKILNKAPLSNPEVSGQPAAGGANEVGFSQSRLPMMSGVDNGNINAGVPATQSASMPAMGGAGGLGVTAVVGLVNGIGGVFQSGNVMNKFAARRQIMGPVFQGGGMIYNVKSRGRSVTQNSNNILNSARRMNRLEQNANNILNTTNRGRIRMNQGQGARNAISQGRVNLRATGTSSNYIYGDVKGIRGRIEKIKTRDLRLKGASKPKSLFVRNLYAPKARRLKIQELTNNGYMGRGKVNLVNNALPETAGKGKKILRLANKTNAVPALAAGNNINVNLNDVNLTKQNGYNLQKQHYMVNKSSNDYVTMIGMGGVARDARNNGLSTDQKAKLYTLTRVSEERRIGSGNTGSSNGYDKTELFRQLVQTVPEMNTRDMRKVASEANRLSEERKKNQQLIANQMANERFDMNRESMNALNDLLKDTSGTTSTRFHNFIEENFKDEIERELTPDEIKEIEEQARENINKRNDLSLEQKEEEYEREKARLLGEKESENSEVIEQLLKERIVDHPEDAESVLGKEGAAALQEQLNNIKDERDRAVVQELIKQNFKDNARFVKKHPEYSKARFEEIYQARQHEEMSQDIETAVGKLYSQREKGSRNEYGKNFGANNPQPQGNSSTVFVPRQVQDRLAGGGMA